tara:strand:- start:274 stop:1164 length:891 start_codon:yes stop_codon:yes gene_type:complete
MADQNQKNVNRDLLSEEQKSLLEKSAGQSDVGLGGASNVEPIIPFAATQREKVYSNDDSYIILGGDRLSSRASGYAGQGHTGAHMVDIVVGRDPTVSGNPSFKGDAARIYVSQKTDVDRAFGLVQGNVGNFKTRSGIGIKADGVRIVAREGIKLVTMGKGTKNSLGNKSMTYTGIDLIAGNDDKSMEPIAKAYRVAEAIEEVLKAIEGISSLVENFLDAQSSFNRTITSHTHVAPPAGPTSPSPELALTGPVAAIRMQVLAKAPMRSHRLSCKMLRINHLEPFTDSWIGSRYNFTN